MRRQLGQSGVSINTLIDLCLGYTLLEDLNLNVSLQNMTDR
ncbi:hypothetical protein ACM9HO_02000 [Pseudomonas sp. KHB2.9]